jgi:hypothetical protein
MGVNSLFPIRNAGCEDVLIERESRLTTWDAPFLHPGKLNYIASRRSASNTALRLRSNLGGGFGLEEAAEARTCELDADQAFTSFGVADVHDAALGGEVCFFFFAAGAELRLRNANFEVGTDGDVKPGDERRAAPA